MDVVSSAAAALQLLGEAVSLVRQIYSAHEAVRAAPKQLADTQAQLKTLCKTVEEIWHESELHTRAIKEQLDVIYDISEELTHILVRMKALQERGKMYQGLYMLMKKTRDEGRLSDVLERLMRAKMELGIRIDVVHVGLTRGVRMGVDRIEKTMMTFDGGGKRSRKKEEEEEKRKRKRAENAAHFYDLRVDENVVDDDGTQMNGIVGFGEQKGAASTRASVVGNRASGRGQQKNFILGSGEIAELRGLG